MKCLAVCLTVLAIGTASIATAASLSERQKNRLLERIGTGLDKKAYAHGVDFGTWTEKLETHRTALRAATSHGEFAVVVNRALDEFSVSHLGLYTPTAMSARKQGNQLGIGVKTVPVEGGRLVTLVLPDSPAAKAELSKGDLLVAVNGQPIGSAAALSGAEGEQVRVSYRRVGRLYEAELRYWSYGRALPLRLEWKEGGIAWLTINSFAKDYYDREVIEGLFAEASTAEGLVLDLRSNGGGSSENVEHLAAQILGPESLLIGEVHREQWDAHQKRYPDESMALVDLVNTSGNWVRVDPRFAETPYAGPLAVLVDGRSGSGADTFPAFIQDNGRGPVIGMRTVGVVLGGDWLKLPYGFSLLYPQAELVRRDGSRLEGNGVTPDIELTPEQTADDTHIERVALAALDDLRTME